MGGGGICLGGDLGGGVRSAPMASKALYRFGSWAGCRLVGIDPA